MSSQELRLHLYDAFDPQRSVGVSGSIWAKSSDNALQRLKARHYTDISLSSSRKTAESVTVSSAGLALFFRQLAVMLDSGTQLAAALHLSSFTEDRYLSGVIVSVGEQVAGGKSLSVAMSRFPGVFDTLIVGLLAAAENSGQLSTTLGRIADAEERRVSLQSQLSSALAYPAFLTVSTLAMTGLFVFYILPIDQELFASLGVELPKITQFLVRVINLAKSPLGIMLEIAAIAAIVAIFRNQTARNQAKTRFVEFLRKFHITRTIIDKARAARMLQVMGLLLRGGSSADVAFKFMISASEDPRQKRLLTEIRDQIIAGEEFGEALHKNDLFPRLVVALLVIGYEAGFLEEMCAKAADMCEEDVRVAIDAATAMIEPILMGFAGLVGGFVIISSALPLLKLVEGL
jgi:type IV pilus assembly protein PilC